METITVTQETGLGLIVSPTTFDLTNAAQDIEIELQKNVQYSVAIDESGVDWIKQGGTKSLSTDKVTFHIAANKSYDDREGKITFKQTDGDLVQTVTVRQSQTNGLFITMPTYDLSNEAHTLSVEVKSNVQFEVTPQVDWIKTVETKALTPTSVVLSIDANESYDNRTGTVIVKQTNGDLSSTITINQHQTDGLFVTPTEFSVNNQEQTIELEVKKNVNYKVVIPDDAKTWVAVQGSNQTKALVEEKVVLLIAKNTTYDDRETSITIKQVDGSLAETVKIKQAYGEGLIIETTSYDVAQEGGVITVEVDANVEYQVDITDEWIHHLETKALSHSSVQLSVDANSLYETRTGIVNVKQVNGGLVVALTIRQAEKIAVSSVELSKTELILKGGDSAQLSATISPSNATDKTLQWSSSDNSIATVDEDGKVTAIKYGIVSIVAKAEDKEGVCSVYVDCIPDNQIRYTMKNGAYSERNGQLIALSAGTKPHDGEDVSKYFGAGVKIVSHVFENGEGIVTFNKPLERINQTTEGLIYYMDRDRITSVFLPDSISEIGQGAFVLCVNLKAVHLPRMLKKISASLFGNCAINTIEIPDSVEEIEDNPFRACGKLESFSGKYVSADKRSLIVNGTLKSFAFSGYEGEYNVPEGVTTIGASSFMLNNGNHVCPNIPKIVLPSSVTKIEKFAFEHSRLLETIELPSSVEEIGYAAFTGCVRLKQITLPSAITKIYEYTFENCSSLTEIDIPNGVTDIGGEAFSNCSKLKTLFLPESVISIGGRVTPGVSLLGHAFDGCTSLTTCYCKATTPPSVIGSTFPSSIKTIHVPSDKVNEYKTAEFWKDYAGKIQGYDF